METKTPPSQWDSNPNDTLTFNNTMRTYISREKIFMGLYINNRLSVQANSMEEITGTSAFGSSLIIVTFYDSFIDTKNVYCAQKSTHWYPFYENNLT